MRSLLRPPGGSPQRWHSRSRRLALVLAITALLPLLGAGPAHAHPLGDFTINIANRVVVDSEGVLLTHVIDLAELRTVQERGKLDPDRDGTTSGPELAAYAAGECSRALTLIELTVDGSAAPLTVQRSSAELRPGNAGLDTTRTECLLRTPTRPSETLTLTDTSSQGRVGWREVSAVTGCGELTATDVPAVSPSGLLTSYPEDLLRSPVDVTTANLSLAGTGSCRNLAATEPGAAQLGRPGDPITSFFTGFLGRRELTAGFALLSVLAATAFGVLHAVAPGHGKTVMAAYLVGQRGTRRQAVRLGAIVTFTHTIGVLLLGALITLGTVAAPERVIPATEVLSGVLLAALGSYLVLVALRRQRAASRHALHAPAHPHDDHDHQPHSHDHDHDPHGHDHQLPAPEHDHEPHDHEPHGHEPHGHDHQPHRHDHDVPSRAREPGGPASVAVAPAVHSHGGRAHSHAPLPEGPIGWRTLVGMGVAGGLVPSPSALIILLAAAGLGRAWFGVVLVLCYGIGMAITLTAAGLLLLRAQGALDRRGWHLGRLHDVGRLLPLLTAGVVVLVGVGLVVRGVAGLRALL